MLKSIINKFTRKRIGSLQLEDWMKKWKQKVHNLFNEFINCLGQNQNNKLTIICEKKKRMLRKYL